MQDQHRELLREHQNNILERALIAFVEDVDGRVPSDDEILNNASHIPFSDTPLSTLVREGVRFTDFFVWKNEHTLALHFDEKAPLELKVVRITKDQWPPALRLYVEQHPKPAPAT